MPVYNGEKYLAEAIESILNQTYDNFELILIDDDSVDHSIDICMYYLKLDNRIRVLKNHNNLGISETTNYGIENARGSLIALMDQDDISLPERLRKEVDFLENNQNIAAVSGNSITILENGELRERNPIYETPGLIRWGLLFRSQIQNSASMIRKSVFEVYKLKYEDYSPAQDYHFWVRASQVVELANIQEYLIYHRLHDRNASKLLESNYLNSVYATRKMVIRAAMGEEVASSTIDGLLDPKVIRDTDQAIQIIKLILNWFKWNQSVGLTREEKNVIKNKTSQKIRNIWGFQNRSYKLLPYLLFTIYSTTL